MNEIKIYQLDHKTVVAEQNGVSASARCHPEDAFNFTVGAKLALERLFDKFVPDFKKGDKVFYNGQVGTVTYVFKKRSKKTIFLKTSLSGCSLLLKGETAFFLTKEQNFNFFQKKFKKILFFKPYAR